MVAAGSATFARLYDAARQVVQQQAGFKEFAPLMKSLDPLLPQEKPLQREADPIALREQGQRTLDAQYKPVLQQLEAHLKKQGLPCEVEAAPVKHLYRMVEKAAFREDEGGKLAGNANFVKDAVRGKCESSEMETLNEALRFLKKLHEAGKIKIVWYKDRFSTPSAGGWADGMLNFVVLEPPDERAHICELQLIHTAMMLQRQGMGGHGSYGKFRSGLELFAYAQATKDLKAMAASSLGGELGALTAQFEAWGRPEHGAFRNWGSAEPLKQWSKVELDEMGHVVKVGAFYVIDLSKSGLVPAFDALKHLKELEIENCKMPGTLEPLKACAALQRLKLYQNQLTGTLEPLKGCAALQTLELHNNQLTGTLEPLKACAALQTLTLNNNQLTGTLEPLKACAALQTLALQYNQLTGTLEPLKACAALQTLALNSNQLTGTLEGLKGCAALQRLALHNNQLTGTLEGLKGCAALQTLALNSNQLTGTLEPLKACAALQRLELNRSQLTGTLEPLKGCAALQTLELNENQLTGTLEPLKGCAALQELKLQSNQLTGALEPLKGCAALQVLRLNFNELTPTEAERTHFGKLQIFSI